MPKPVELLGIAVSDDLVERWTQWFAPTQQPFRVDTNPAACEVDGERREPEPEVRDTFWMYAGDWVWLREDEFAALPFTLCRALLTGREATGRLSRLEDSQISAVGSRRTGSRIVWWPDLIRRVGPRPIFDYVLDGVRPSRHGEISWVMSERALPGAGSLAGTFPDVSGPNCFATVMGAAGVDAAADRQIDRGAFDRWLTEASEPIRGPRLDGTAGVVLVWRDRSGQVEHAAVTVGDGYALVKPSQAWCSPRVVWTVPETIAAGRVRGLHLERHQLLGAV